MQMALRRTLLDRMIYLVQLGYVLPVLKYIKRISSSVDESLIVHTIKMVGHSNIPIELASLNST